MSTGTAVDVVMPQMGVSVSEGTITRWAKQVGEHVDADETIVEISTDKVDTEVPSPGSGIVTEILVAEGETVDVGTRIAVISSGDGASAPAPEAAAEAPAAPEACRCALPRPRPRPRHVAETDADADEDESNGNGDGEARSFMSPVVARMVSEHSLEHLEDPRHRTRRPGHEARRRGLLGSDEGVHAGDAAPPAAARRGAGSGARPSECACRTVRRTRSTAGGGDRAVTWGVEESSPLPMIRKVIAATCARRSRPRRT